MHSLAIVVEPEALVDSSGEVSDPISASESTQQLWRLLEEDLGGILPSLHSMEFLSLPVLRGRNHFWLPRPLLATLPSRLPGTCTSVEIDTLDSDRAEPGARHLCEAVRDILPRLEHLRLDLSAPRAKAWEIRNAMPETQLPSRSRASPVGHYNSRLCDSYVERTPVHSAFFHREEAVPDLVYQLQTVIHLLPKLSRCIIIDQSGTLQRRPSFPPHIQSTRCSR